MPRRRRANAFWTHRIRAGLTQAELAAALGVSRQTISAVECRRSVPSVTLAIGIARALDMSVEELFGG